MPLYDYRCKECDKVTTITRAFADKEQDYKCDTCNSILHRVYSTIGVTFNGSGFYSTDK